MLSGPRHLPIKPGKTLVKKTNKQFRSNGWCGNSHVAPPYRQHGAKRAQRADSCHAVSAKVRPQGPHRKKFGHFWPHLGIAVRPHFNVAVRPHFLFAANFFNRTGRMRPTFLTALFECGHYFLPHFSNAANILNRTFESAANTHNKKNIHFRITVDMTLIAGCNMAALSKVRFIILAAEKKCGQKSRPQTKSAVRKVGRRKKVRSNYTTAIKLVAAKERPHFSCAAKSGRTCFFAVQSDWHVLLLPLFHLPSR